MHFNCLAVQNITFPSLTHSGIIFSWRTVHTWVNCVVCFGGTALQNLKTTVDTVLWTMLKSKTFVKKTRSGGVLKIVREHYLRDDIWCGSEVCKECKDEAPVLQEHACIESDLCSYPHYLIPDTNVLLHQVCGFSLFRFFINSCLL